MPCRSMARHPSLAPTLHRSSWHWTVCTMASAHGRCFSNMNHMTGQTVTARHMCRSQHDAQHSGFALRMAKE